MRKAPGFTLTVFATLAIGIGANIAVFSSMDAVVLRPLAIPALDRVVAIVNDEAITQYELDEAKRIVIQQLKQQNVQQPAGDVLEKQVLERLVTERALLQFAKENGVKVDDNQIERTVQRIAEENKLYEICKYLSLTSHQWAGYNMIANNDFWQRLPSQIQEVVVRNTKTFVAQQRAFVRGANANLEQTLRQHGMTVNTVELESFRERLRGANFYRDWRQSIGDEAWALMEAKVGKVG